MATAQLGGAGWSAARPRPRPGPCGPHLGPSVPTSGAASVSSARWGGGAAWTGAATPTACLLQREGGSFTGL